MLKVFIYDLVKNLNYYWEYKVLVDFMMDMGEFYYFVWLVKKVFFKYIFLID